MLLQMRNVKDHLDAALKIELGGHSLAARKNAGPDGPEEK